MVLQCGTVEFRVRPTQIGKGVNPAVYHRFFPQLTLRRFGACLLSGQDLLL